MLYFTISIKSNREHYSEGAPSFADINFGTDAKGSSIPFGISLTITREDFSNYLHRDRDYTADAYGWWWTGKFDEELKRYTLDPKANHDKIQGGAFLWGEYAVGVDFERLVSTVAMILI